jgi:hypothetical protein
MHRAFIGSVLAIAALVTACRDVSAPEPALHIQTSDISYPLNGGIGRQIPATVTNVGLQPITLAACGTLVTSLPERWLDGRWEDQTFLACDTLTPLRLDPGETRELYVVVRVVGAFRLRVPLFIDSTHQVPSPEASPVFNIL